MTLDEAIKHAEEVAKKQENNAKSYPKPDKSVKGSGKKYNACLKCAEEHRQLAEWLKELKQLREQTRWIPVSEGLPEKDGDYLVIVKGMRNYIKCCYFALNLYKVDKYDFENKKGVAGFYEYDSEYGYYEMTTEVIAWCELPEPYKASSTGAEGSDKE